MPLWVDGKFTRLRAATATTAERDINYLLNGHVSMLLEFQDFTN